MIELIALQKHRELAEKAAKWFHQKWGIALEAYQESIEACIKGDSAIPQWYLAMEQERSVKSTSNCLWQFPFAAKAASRRSTMFHAEKRQRQAFFIRI